MRASCRRMLFRARGLSSFKEPSSLCANAKRRSDSRQGMAQTYPELTIGLRKLDVGTGFHTAVGFPKYLWPFRDALGYTAKVNEIEGTLIGYQFRCTAQRKTFRILMGMSTSTRHRRPQIYCLIVSTGQPRLSAKGPTSSEEACLAAR
jgi:hypothetical protein